MGLRTKEIGNAVRLLKRASEVNGIRFESDETECAEERLDPSINGGCCGLCNISTTHGASMLIGR